MKKSFISVAILAFLCGGFASCTKEDTFVAKDFVQSYPNNGVKLNGNDIQQLKELERDIALLNKESFGESDDNSRSNFFRKIRTFWRIVIADAVGALFGASGGPVGTFIGAASASGVASTRFGHNHVVVKPLCILDVSNANSSSIIPDTIKVNVDLTNIVPRKTISNPVFCEGKRVYMDSIGYYHNKAFIEMNTELPDWPSLDVINLTDVFGKKMVRLSGVGRPEYVQSFVSPQSPIIRTNVLVGQLVEDDECDVIQMCTSLKDSRPEHSQVIDVLQECVLGLQRTAQEGEELMNYTEKVLLLLENKNINSDLKFQLRSGILVANASAKLWDTQIE